MSFKRFRCCVFLFLVLASFSWNSCDSLGEQTITVEVINNYPSGVQVYYKAYSLSGDSDFTLGIVVSPSDGTKSFELPSKGYYDIEARDSETQEVLNTAYHQDFNENSSISGYDYQISISSNGILSFS